MILHMGWYILAGYTVEHYYENDRTPATEVKPLCARGPFLKIRLSRNKGTERCMQCNGAVHLFLRNLSVALPAIRSGFERAKTRALIAKLKEDLNGLVS